jgi:hypothetical protein
MNPSPKRVATRHLKATSHRDVEEAYEEFLGGIDNAKEALAALSLMLKEGGFDTSGIFGIRRLLSTAKSSQFHQDVHDLMDTLKGRRASEPSEDTPDDEDEEEAETNWGPFS